MFALILVVLSFFSSDSFSKAYNTKCFYDPDESNGLANCDEEQGEYVFVFNTNNTSNIKFYNDGSVVEIENTGMKNRNYTMADGTNSQIINCVDWTDEICTLQYGTNFTRLTFKELGLVWYFYNK